MPPIGPGSARPESVEALLRDLGPRLRRAGSPREAPGHRPTGMAGLDRLLGGGFPCGRISEVAGPASSGRTSLALGLLARATCEGEAAAVVDGADAFDPASARAAGVDLDRTLWVRAPRAAEALRAAEILLGADGFALVLLDLGALEPGVAGSRWLRLARRAAGSRAALVVLADGRRVVGTHAELALEMRPARPRFGGAPPLLEALEVEAAVVRHRRGPEGGVRLRFRSPPPEG